jgi:hypothetical protein
MTVQKTALFLTTELALFLSLDSAVYFATTHYFKMLRNKKAERTLPEQKITGI